MAFFNNTRDEDTPDESPNVRFYNVEQTKKKNEILTWIEKHGGTKEMKNYDDFLSFMEPKYLVHNAIQFVNGELADTKYLALWDDGSCLLKNVTTHGASAMYLYYRAFMDSTTITIRKNNAHGEILATFKVNKTKGNSIRKIPFKKINETLDLYFEANNDEITKQVITSHITWLTFLTDIPGAAEAGFDQINQAFLELLNTPNTRTPNYG
tara:strand:- start:290 stop:919 length:630 start_codon:yes stop_codon:yes gene_type:complete